MADMRIGAGYDVHRLVENRKLVIGGVEIPFRKGLLGHSDADVLLHAVCDALLGALGLGDIGQHFPDSDPGYRDIASTRLLTRTYQKVTRAGFGIVNLDSTVFAQAPRLAPYRQRMRETIAGLLGLPVARVSVKATTTEGLGPMGRGEGIAAACTVLLQGRPAPPARHQRKA